MTLSALILTHDRPEEILQCLSSLQEEMENLLEIIILDNGSHPPLRKEDFSGFAKLTFLYSKKNLGVAAGRNYLAQQARGDLLWFINDDAALVCQNACTLIRSYFEQKDLGLISFKVINRFTNEEEYRCIPDRRKQPTSTDLPASYFVGCSFVMPKVLFIQLGGFWEPLYYSCEELDLSYRILESEYSVIRSSSLQVLHSFSQTENRTSSWIYFNTRNRSWTALRNLPLRYAISQTVLWWTYIGWISLKEKKFSLFLKAMKDCLQGISLAYQTRSIISLKTRNRVRSLGGRIWY